MMKNLLCIIALLSLMTVAACKQQGGSKSSVELKTDEDKTFYAVGALFGGRLKPLQLTDAELESLVFGIRDSAKGVESKVDLVAFQPKIQELFQSRMGKQSEEIKKKGQEYLENFVKNEGAKKTESGLAYKIITEGTGKNPKAEDMVEVHYHGTLMDGTVFDSSVERGKRVSFPLNRVIKGWTEGLQLIKEGGKVKLVIPSDLAYGDHGAPPKIPGGSTLIFEVELFSAKAQPATEAPPAVPGKPKKK
ncbi:MAG: FKBP-type peptidyl-prolyl cis-trans isomerase [Bdellovibrionota bacterium]